MKVAVVGAGITGLVAAYRVRCAFGPAADLTVVERSRRIGGSLRTVDFAGGPIDVGAEAFVARRPEIPDLLAELGLTDQLVAPGGLRPLLRALGRMHPLPERTLMGIPADAESVGGLVDSDTAARIAAEPQRPFRWDRNADPDVAALVADRFGAQVVQRSVDPLLGGVYAGLAGSIGVRAALPALAAALDAGASSLTAAVAAALPPPSGAPVFGGIRDGYGVLLDELRNRAAATERTGTAVDTVRRKGNAWSLGSVGDDFDAVIIASPAPVAARLLLDIAPAAAAAAAGIPLASSALVAMALPESTPLPENSGILVATGESLRAKAFTFSSQKWPHLARRGARLVRASFGRYGDETPLHWSDAELVAAAVGDLAEIVGAPIDPVATVVQRWPGGLPQYLPGHLDRVSAIRSGIADVDGIEVAGSYLQGVGVGACVASASAAASRISR